MIVLPITANQTVNVFSVLDLHSGVGNPVLLADIFDSQDGSTRVVGRAVDSQGRLPDGYAPDVKVVNIVHSRNSPNILIDLEEGQERKKGRVSCLEL